MHKLARTLVASAIVHANAALTAREAGDSRSADRHSRHADMVAACASKAGTSYVLAFQGNPLAPALQLLEAAETYGREASCFGGRV